MLVDLEPGLAGACVGRVGGGRGRGHHNVDVLLLREYPLHRWWHSKDTHARVVNRAILGVRSVDRLRMIILSLTARHLLLDHAQTQRTTEVLTLETDGRSSRDGLGACSSRSSAHVELVAAELGARHVGDLQTSSIKSSQADIVGQRTGAFE